MSIASSWGTLFQGSRQLRTWPPSRGSVTSRIVRVVWPARDKSGWKESLLDAASDKLLGGVALDGMNFRDVFESFCEEEERVLCGPSLLLSKWYRMASNIVEMKLSGTWLFLRRYHHENKFDDWERAEKDGRKVTSVEIFETERLREIIPKIAPALVKLRLLSVIDKLRAMELACVRLLKNHTSDDALNVDETKGGKCSHEEEEEDELKIILESRDRAMALYKHWETRYEKACSAQQSCLSAVSSS